jgi:hypothetical protein
MKGFHYLAYTRGREAPACETGTAANDAGSDGV